MKKIDVKYFRDMIARKCIAACIYIIIGVAMLVFRDRTPEIICRILGAGLFFVGLYNLIYHIVHDEVVLGLPCDILLLVMGAVLIAFARGIAALVAMLLGVFMILKAVFGMQDALLSKKTGEHSWLVDLIYSIVMLIMGVLLVLIPFRGLAYMTIIMGIVLIADGVLGLTAFVINYKLRRDSNDEKDCVIEAETIDSCDEDI